MVPNEEGVRGRACLNWRGACRVPRSGAPGVLAWYPRFVSDTARDAILAQAAAHRRMSGVRKILMSCAMSDEVRAIACARIESQHPEFTEEEVRDQLVWELYGIRRPR